MVMSNEASRDLYTLFNLGGDFGESPAEEL